MTAKSETSSLEFSPNRGREATSPLHIPPAGWRDISWRVFRGVMEDRVLLTAAGVSFYVLLALVPTLTAFVSIYGLFASQATVIEHVDLLTGLVPDAALNLIRDQLDRLTSENTTSLGLTLLVSLLIALWSAGAGIRAMFEAMNVAYHEAEKRNIIVVHFTALIFTIGAAIAALLVIATVVFVPVILSFVPGAGGLKWLVRIASYVVMLAVLSFGIAALYRWGPSRNDAKWRWITPGTALAVIGLGIGSISFSWYVTNFNDYGAAYGSLGALIALLTWVWISASIVILGAELNSEIEHQTARDSTTGPEQPLGKRGAHMADTIGRIWPLGRGRRKSS